MSSPTARILVRKQKPDTFTSSLVVSVDLGFYAEPSMQSGVMSLAQTGTFDCGFLRPLLRSTPSNRMPSCGKL